MSDVIAQIFGILALVAMVLSYQQKERVNLLRFQMVSNALFVVNYLMLGFTTGAIMSAINIGRSFVFSKSGKKWADYSAWLYLFLGVTLVSGVPSFINDGPLSLLVTAATLLLTITLYSKNLAFMRKMFLVIPFLYIAYNVACGSVGAIGNDVFSIISAIIAIWRFDIKKKKAESKEAEQEIS